MSYRLEEVNFDPFAGAQQQLAGVTLEPVDFDPFAPKQEPPAPEEDNILPAIGRGLEKGGLMLAQTASDMATTMPGSLIKSGIAESERIEPLSPAGVASAFPTFRPLARFLPGYHAGGGLEPTRPALKKTLDEAGDILLEAGKTGREFYGDIRKDVDQAVPESRRGKDFIDDPGLLLNPSYLAEASVESIVSMVPPLVAAFAGGGPAVAGAIGGGMEGLGALGEMVDDGMQPDEALVRSGAYGMASAALNAYSFDKILSKQVVDGLIKKGAKVLGAAGVEGFTEWLEGPIQALAQYTGALPMVQDGSMVGQSAARGLEIARTPDSPQDMTAALTKAAREEAAVIPGAFIAGGGATMIAPSEGDFTFSEEDKGGQTRRKLENNEPVDLMDAAPRSDQGQPAVDPRIQAKRQALMNAFADLQRQAQAQAEMPTTPDQQVIEQQVGIGQPPARPAGYYEQPIIGQEQLREFEQGMAAQPGPAELYPVDDLEAEWNARMAEQDAMSQQARLEAEWYARGGRQPFGGLQMPGQESAPSSPAVGNIPGQQAQGLQIQPSELAPSFQDSTVSELPDISREGFNGEGVKEIKTWWGIKSTDTIVQIKRAQITGENITLAEAERRGREAAARRESERRAAFSEEEMSETSQNQDAGGKKQTAGQERETGRTANDYTVETEDFGTMGVRVIRSEDGSVTIFTDKNTITHNSDFASGKSDEDLLAYSFEPSGFKGASRVENALDQKAHEAATSPLNDRPEPTEAQKEAGNYAKGHVSIGGMDISIENPAGSVRSGRDAQGREWQVDMRHHYGYIRGTKGADKDHVDVFISPGAEAGGPVFVVNQNDPATGKFDEHKAIIGAADEQQARDIYLANYEPGWQGLGSIVQMSMDGFKKWAKTEKTAQPAVGGIETSADLPGVGTVTAPAQSEASPYTLTDISEKAFVVTGDTKPIKDKMKSLGGLWNGKRGGWVFSKKKREKVQAALGVAKEQQASGDDVRKAEELAAQYQRDGRTRSDFIEEAPLKLGWIYRTFTGSLQEAPGTDARRKAFESAGYSRPGSVAEIWDRAVGGKGDKNEVGNVLAVLGGLEGTSVEIVKAQDGFSVIVRDDDSGKSAGAAYIYKDYDQAKRAANAISKGMDPKSAKAPGTLGKNRHGLVVGQDDKGVRYYDDGGIRIMQTVGVIPGGGIKIDTPERLHTLGGSNLDFLTTEELERLGQEPQAQKPAAAPTRDEYADLFDEELAAATAPKPKKPLVKRTEEERAQAATTKAPKEKKPLVKKPKDKASDAAKKMADGAAAALDVFSKYGGLSVRVVKEGEEINQDLYRELKPHLLKVLEGAREMGHAGKDLAREVVRFLIKAFGEKAAKAKPYFMQFVDEEILKEKVDDPGRNAGDNAPALEGELSAGVQGPGAEDGGKASPGVRKTDADGDGRAEGGRGGRSDSVDGSKEPVLSDTAPGDRGGLDSPLNPGEGRNKKDLAGENPGNFAIPEDFALGEGSDGQKIKANIEAIKTLKRIQAERRFPTREEQAAMARFVGWGGLANVFDPTRAESTDMFGRAQRELKALLTDKEYSAAWSSTRNAHYTAPDVVRAMWQALSHFGFRGGRALEPTVGIGNFLGLQPQDLAASTEWHASELDAMTGHMAAMIYPEANILAATGFQDAPFANGVFDVAIGNPPFGDEPIHDKKRPHLSGMKIHNYIIGKAGDHLRPGGVMAMVVTHRFLDTANPEARAYLSQHFKFMGAFRLPNDAFLKNAGTEVVTDVIFFQKLREGEQAETNASWLDVNGEVQGKDGKGVRVNRYYQENPGNILGVSSMEGTMYRGGGQEYTVHSDGRDMREAMASVIVESFSDLQGAMTASPVDVDAAPVMLAQSHIPIGGMMLDEDGVIRRRDMDDSKGNAVIEEVTPETLWKDDAQAWDSAVEYLRAVKGGRAPLDEETMKAEVFPFAYSASGAERPKPTKAEAAIYSIVRAMSQPEFKWKHNAELAEIETTLGRKRLGEDGYSRLKGMLGLRNKMLRLIAAEKQDLRGMEQVRRDLREAYDQFVKKFGYVNDPKNFGLMGGDIGAESGLEIAYTKAVSKEQAARTGEPARKASAVPADILTKRVNFPRKVVDKADKPADALHISITERGKVDIPFMAKLLGMSPVDVISALQSGDHPMIFLNPETEAYEDADSYLSGNVRKKLDKAIAAGMTANARALEAALPAPKTKEQIRPNIRGMWIPEKIFVDFLRAMGVTSPNVKVYSGAGKIMADGGAFSLSEFGQQFTDKDATVVDMFQSAVDGQPLQVWRGSGDDRRRDHQAEIRVNALVERMTSVFPEWVYADEQRTQTVVDAFNQTMNTHVPRQFDGEKYLVTVGANPSIRLRRTQKNAAWRMMQSPAVLLDHVVGAGKTFTIITGLMERRRIGLSRKPMIVVPNHLVTQWAADFYRLYPGAKILAATPADFAKKNRRRLFARIASGDFDAVIVGHSSFGFIEAPSDDIEKLIDEKVTELKDVLEEAKRTGASKRTVKQMKKRLDSYEAKLKALKERPADDIGIDLHAMGVDYLAVDEAHEFKNLEYSTSAERVVGMNDPSGSKKAFDLLVKLRGMRARGGSVAFATGTPVSNSLVEIYSIMQYLAFSELSDRSMRHFDAWSGAYVSTKTKLEYTPTQKLKPRRVLAGLENLSSLRQLYEHFADIITMSDLKRIYAEDVRTRNKKTGKDERTEFPVPKVKGGKRRMDDAEASQAQSEYMDYLVARADVMEQRKDPEYSRIDNMLWVMSDARKMALDIRIVDPRAKRDENGKVMRSARNIKEIYDKWTEQRGTQLVFCDLSVPSKGADKAAVKALKGIAVAVFGESDGKRIMSSMGYMTYVEQWERLQERIESRLESEELSDRERDAAEKALEQMSDLEGLMNTADTGFSVYDDLRAVLVESGIPSSEVAFIHDYDTPEKKEALFTRVKNGYVRVLIGSSSKMGAGMNVQDRLVALHHLDAPWRPSDMEQREGRIIRQGNIFYAADPEGFEVEIIAYSTKATSDTVMWQILERKAAAIEQFRQGGLDTVSEESGDADQYAEFMANSTGNPAFRLKLEAERRYQQLQAEIGGKLIARQDAISFLNLYGRMGGAERVKDTIEFLSGLKLEAAERGGKTGSLDEAEAVLRKAQNAYVAEKAEYGERKEIADAAVLEWSQLPEETRGPKPKMPVAPVKPTIVSKEIQAKSGYAKIVSDMLDASEGGKDQAINLGHGVVLKLEAEPSSEEGSFHWSTTLQFQGGNSVYLGRSVAKSARNSGIILDSLAPWSIRQAAESALNSAKREKASLEKRREAADRAAAVEVDKTAMDEAEAEVSWYKDQVAFAEVEASLRREGATNQYIAMDRTRPLTQSRPKGQKEEASVVTVDGEEYELSGLFTMSSDYAGNSRSSWQAKRVSDGLPAFVHRTKTAEANAEWVISGVDLQPESIRKAKAAPQYQAGTKPQIKVIKPYQPTMEDIREAFPWADKIEQEGNRYVITKGKISFSVEYVRAITPDKIAFQLHYGRTPGPRDLIAGAYLGKGEIIVSRHGDRWTLSHEYEHFLEDMGLINKMEQAILDAEIAKRAKAGTLPFKIMDSRAENRAYFVQHAMEQRDWDRKTPVGRILQRIADFIDALVNLYRRTARGIVRGAESGKVMDGKATATKSKAAQNQQAKTSIWGKGPVPVVTVHVGTAPSLEEAQQALRALRGSSVVNKDTGWEIGFSKRGLGKTESHQAAAESRIGAVRLREMTEKAVLVATEENRDEASRGHVRFFHHLYVPMRMNGALALARIVVKETPQGQKYYDSIVAKMEKPEAGSYAGYQDRETSATGFSKTGISIRTLLEMVKVVRPDHYPAAEDGDFDGRAADIHYQLAGMDQVKRHIDAAAYRPETFGLLNFIHTQVDKALKSPQFRMVFDRISDMARTVSASASSAAALAEDILPSPDKGFVATLKDVIDKGRFADNDLKEASVALSAASLAGDSPSPFDGKVFTEDELLNGVEIHGKTYRLTPDQIEAYRQTRASVNKSVWDLATSEAWKRIRPFVNPDLWQVFADNSAMSDVRMEALMYDALDLAERDAKAAQAAVLAQAGVRDMEQLAAHEKELTKFIRKMRKLARDMKKAENSEDAMEKIEAIEEKMDLLESEYGMSMDDAVDDLKALRKAQKTHRDAVKKIANIEGTIHDVFEEDGIFDKARRLQAGGYMPLMRFGAYEIRIEDEDGRGVAMYRFDSSTEAKLAYDELVAKYEGDEGITITRPVKINTEAWKRFKDVNPDSILLFAKESDFGSDQAMQEVYRKLYSDRSSMKRLIRRKGIPGYSDDLQRILSSFITSNARRIAANYHNAPVEQLITDIGNNDVQQEAQKVFEFFQGSGDPGSWFRSFAAHLRLLGSPMTAAINGTQVFTSTFPELVKHGATTTEALGRIIRAYRDRFKKDPARMTADEKWAIAKGESDGTIDSAEIFHLYGMGTQSLIDKAPGGRRFKRSASAALRARGMAFAWAEKLNRHVALLSAFRMFKDQGMSREDAYQKAREVVDVTQGRYGKENRPNLGRNPIAGAMLTFMQYKIMTLEQIVRNARGDKQAKKAAALQILILMMLGGLGGAPFAEDAMDLLDIIMQTLFDRAWLSKNKLKKAVRDMSESAAGALVGEEAGKMFGKFAAGFLDKGLSGLPGMPLDVSGKYRVGGTIPGLKVLKPSTKFRESAILDAFGVPGGMIDDAVRAIDLALNGDPWRGAQLWLPSDVQNYDKALDIVATGKIRDSAGRTIVEGGVGDALLQGMGAQPRKKSEVTSPLWEKKELLHLTQKTESDFVRRYAEARADGDEAAFKAVREEHDAWNRNNPDWPIRITQMQIRKAMMDRAKTQEQRQMRMAPKEVRKNFVPGAQ